MRISKLPFKLFFRLLGYFNSSLDFKSVRGFDSSTKYKFLENINSISINKQGAIDHWNEISTNIVDQITNDDKNFLRNPWVRNALHPNQYYYSFLYYKKLRENYSKEKLKHLCRDIGLGNPLNDIMVQGASPASLKHFFLLDNIQRELGIDFRNLNQIVEFGGGYGSMCRVFFDNMENNICWNIVDLPIIIELQKAYLSDSLKKEDFNKITFNTDCKNIKVDTKSLFIATWSLSETPLSLRYNLENWISSFDYIYITFQKQYGEISNYQYFNGLKGKLESHEVNIKQSNIYNGHYYLICRSKRLTSL